MSVPNFTVSPTIGNIGTLVTVTSSGFYNLMNTNTVRLLDLTVDPETQKNVASFNKISSTQLTFTMIDPLPEISSPTFDILLIGSGWAYQVAGSFTIGTVPPGTATFDISPTSGYVGSNITIDMLNLSTPITLVQLYYYRDNITPPLKLTVVPTVSTLFQIQFTVPDVSTIPGTTFPYVLSVILTGDTPVTVFEAGTINVLQNTICFLGGSKILCRRDCDWRDTEINVEEIVKNKEGILVKTFEHGYKKVTAGKKTWIENRGDSLRIKDRLYKLTPQKYPELNRDLILTGSHAILTKNINYKDLVSVLKHYGKVMTTDEMFRLPAFCDDRADCYESEGGFSVYHIALENADCTQNYGIYANNLLVETCSEDDIRK